MSDEAPARRLRLTSAPRPSALVERAVHEIVRDYPEVLAALGREGVDVAAVGGRRLDELERGAELAVVVARSAAWRPAP